jgi:benzodiazapine receptor
MQFESTERRWRWLSLVIVVANVAFTSLSPRLPIGEGTIGSISAKYATLFTPSGYAFAIWGLIHFATTVYAIHQLLPSQRSTYAHDLVARPLILMNLLAMVWVVVFRYELIALSVAVIAVALVASLILFLRATSAVARHELSKWVLVPASLWFGWLSVAAIANVSLWTAALDWTDAVQVEWTLAMIALAALLGLGVGYRYRNWMYPLVIAWAAAAVWVARREDEPFIASAALASAVVMLAWSGYCMVRARRDRSGFRIFRGPIDAR